LEAALVLVAIALVELAVVEVEWTVLSISQAFAKSVDEIAPEVGETEIVGMVSSASKFRIPNNFKKQINKYNQT
jgi:hypothetical protein